MQPVVGVYHVNKTILWHSIDNLEVLALSCRRPAVSLSVKGIPIQWEVPVGLLAELTIHKPALAINLKKILQRIECCYPQHQLFLLLPTSNSALKNLPAYCYPVLTLRKTHLLHSL